jgi:hypothetical protein
MANIKVKLEAFYGYGHGCSYGSKDTIELEISEQELEALKKFGTKEISCEEVLEAIENGETVLQSLHEQLEEKFYYMVEEYWLFEAYNEFLGENLEKYIEQDIDDKLYTPIPFEEVANKVKAREIKFSTLSVPVDFRLSNIEELEEIGVELSDKLKEFKETAYDWDTHPDGREMYDRYVLNHYYEWIREQGHDFAADRVGVDILAIRENEEVDYTIMLE